MVVRALQVLHRPEDGLVLCRVHEFQDFRIGKLGGDLVNIRANGGLIVAPEQSRCGAVVRTRVSFKDKVAKKKNANTKETDGDVPLHCVRGGPSAQ